MKLANASFSHRSFHHAIVTRSPNHWCDISCAMIPFIATRAASAACSSSSSRSSRNVISPAFSIAPALKLGTASRSSLA
jgi:hypothetical protein